MFFLIQKPKIIKQIITWKIIKISSTNHHMKFLLWVMIVVFCVCFNTKTKNHQTNHHLENHQKIINKSSHEVSALGDDFYVLCFFNTKTENHQTNHHLTNHQNIFNKSSHEVDALGDDFGVLCFFLIQKPKIIKQIIT